MQYLSKFLLCVLLFPVSCAPAQMATTVPPTEVLNQYPTLMPTPTLAVNTRPIGEAEKEEAYDFFYGQKIHVTLGEYEHFAEAIRYPITANVDGKPRTFIFPAELEASFEKIFSQETIQQLASTDESALTFTDQGVKVGDGILWFDLICMDPACDAAEFLVTEINN